MHAVHRLYLQRKAESTKPFNARGKAVDRCSLCHLAKKNCICSLKKQSNSQCAFLLIMHDIEVLKPSNTGKLIADIVPNTFAFQWSRTEVNDQLINIINNDKYQPYVVFPEQYAVVNSKVVNTIIYPISEKIPLFIVLDGSWREAKKMFRKSPYLENIPVLSICVDSLVKQGFKSLYSLRKSQQGHQLATAEVASLLLTIVGEHNSAHHLSLWSQLFEYRYQKSVCQLNTADSSIEQRYETFYHSISD